ncbi:MAG TPA: DciA family protein [Caulobacteraceae bacterium]|jgi:hypothetical protein|nr:DciA family protein [Caulobacteraceae bacterium]
MRRSLPSSAEALAILAARRPRPPPLPPRHAARGLAAALRPLEEKFGRGSDDLKTRWKEIVGEALAGRSEPMKLVKSRSGGATLELKVAGPVAALIQHQAPLILDRLNLYLGPGSVARLRIVQGPLSKPLSPAMKVAARRRAKGPLDSAAERALADGLAEASDGPLKDALLKLGREVLRSQGR